MSNNWHHPEGVHEGMNFLDRQDWTLERYVRCLESETVLNKCIEVAHWEATHRPPESILGEKWTMRYRGLQLLRDVDNVE